MCLRLTMFTSWLVQSESYIGNENVYTWLVSIVGGGPMSKEAVFTMKLEPELRAEFMAEAEAAQRLEHQCARLAREARRAVHAEQARGAERDRKSVV